MQAEIAEFGKTAAGQQVQVITLRGGDLVARVLTWGAVLQDLRLAEGAYSLTLGSEDLADYEGDMRHHGSVIGPVVNRLTEAQAPIGGVMHRFEANQDGRLTLHSGKAGTHLKVWQIARATAESATLALDLPDGEGGFPGARRIEARFDVLPPATLRLTITTTTDRDTLANVTNHSYWNLDGSESITGHSLQIFSAHVLPTTPDFVPSGEIRAVGGTAFDFRQPRLIAPETPPLDNCFCLADAQGPLRPALVLKGSNGLTLTVKTTEAGVQVYDGRAARRPNRPAYEGLAIETQGWPDAPNHAGFASIELAAGDTLTQITEWHFAR